MVSAVLYVLATISSVLGATQRYELELTNRFIAPDGFNRSSVLANRGVPGPLISAFKNDQLQVNIVNKLTNETMAQGTSIHWHGLFQHKTASQDGVSWVTQCPIAPGDTYLYNFNVGAQAGTYWYHSHITTQYCDGLRGPLIIYDHQDPLRHLYDVDDENTVITLEDWFTLPSPAAFTNFLNPVSNTLNGLGRYPGGPKGPLSVVGVRRGLRYRFRLINTACLAAYNISIDGHTLSVIEADGNEVEPRAVDVVSLFPGQRLSIIVKANQVVGNYWIRAVPFVLGETASDETGVNAAILRYSGAKNADPRTVKTGSKLLREQDLVPLAKSDWVAGKPDMSITLQIGLNDQQTLFTINGNIYAPPTIPVLLQLLNGTANAHSIMPNGSVITLPRNKLIEVTIPGGSPFAPHPFHLHGHAFAVVRSAGSKTSNYKDAPMRDVVNTGLAGDNVTFRFRTDNPGPWIMHCHIDFHLEAALAVVFAEDPKGQVSGPDAQETPKKWESLCPKWEALKTGKQFSVSDFL